MVSLNCMGEGFYFSIMVENTKHCMGIYNMMYIDLSNVFQNKIWSIYFRSVY